jgi:uncharacterized protein YkwD
MRHALALSCTLATAALAVLFAGPAPSADAAYERLLAPTSRCAGQIDQTASVARQTRAMRCMIAYARRKAGRRPLKSAPKQLRRAAGNKARDIVRCNQFSHTACGRPFTFWLSRAGYTRGCYGAGENLGWGSGGSGSVRSILLAWLNSAGHRKNLLDRSFRAQGVALARGTLSGVPAQVWVHELGYRC